MFVSKKRLELIIAAFLSNCRCSLNSGQLVIVVSNQFNSARSCFESEIVSSKTIQISDSVSSN